LTEFTEKSPRAADEKKRGKNRAVPAGPFGRRERKDFFPAAGIKGIVAGLLQLERGSRWPFLTGGGEKKRGKGKAFIQSRAKKKIRELEGREPSSKKGRGKRGGNGKRFGSYSRKGATRTLRRKRGASNNWGGKKGGSKLFKKKKQEKDYLFERKGKRK